MANVKRSPFLAGHQMWKQHPRIRPPTIMRKITFEISAPALQATMVCLATFVLAGGLIWAYIQEESLNQLAGQPECESSARQVGTIVRTAMEAPTTEQSEPVARPEPTDGTKFASSPSKEPSSHPKTLVGPLTTNLANLVVRFQQNSHVPDRVKLSIPAPRSRTSE